jgi:hypothetical protein
LQNKERENTDQEGEQKPAEQTERSIAFEAGQHAKRNGIPLRQSALRALRPGCKQYDDFIDGYDSITKSGNPRRPALLGDSANR